jgi:hypothetical protein
MIMQLLDLDERQLVVPYLRRRAMFRAEGSRV